VSDIFQKQDPMRRVVYSLSLIFVYSIWLYGWRVIALALVVFPLGILSEFIFENQKKKKISEAVYVTCMLYTLSLPPAVPLWVAGIGIIFGIVIGKEIFGGFGRNIFNPAIIGRIFIYLSFPLLVQNTWIEAGQYGGAFSATAPYLSDGVESLFMIIVSWFTLNTALQNKDNHAKALKITLFGLLFMVFGNIVLYKSGEFIFPANTTVDLTSTPTPLALFRNQDFSFANFSLEDDKLSFLELFFGLRLGSIGEGSIFLIILGGIYLIKTGTANYRSMYSAIVASLLSIAIFYYAGLISVNQPYFSSINKNIMTQVTDILSYFMSGGLLYMCVFMVTDPVTAPNKPLSLYIYGALIGFIVVLIRVFSPSFPEGISFAVLFGNMFASLIDEYVPKPVKKK